MNYISLKLKILFMFFVPIVALIYFSFLSIDSEYNRLTKAQTINNSAKITKILTILVYNMQLERGLSSGYIVTSNKKNYKKQLIQQYKKSDKAYNTLFHLYQKHSLKPTNLHKNIGIKIQPLIKEIFSKLTRINRIRKSVLNSSVNFIDEIKYYTDINKKLILAIQIFNPVNNEFNIDTAAFTELESIKELAGLERAYTYYLLLSGPNLNLSLILKEFGVRKTDLLEEFLLTASEESINIYRKNLLPSVIYSIHLCKNNLLNGLYDEKNALSCFNKNTDYIKMLNKISKEIFTTYITKVNKISESALRSLYITIILWITSLISLLILIYILRKTLIDNEISVNKLRIASYAFNSQEAMLITDTEANIIEVNEAFTSITLYPAHEVIGKNTHILSSNKHDKEFFSDMWQILLETGKWKGELYNKRKNGEIYPEMLSITAIKDNKNITTHYIAQFLDLTEIKEAQEKIQYQVDHDFLTNILNKKSMLQRLQEEYNKAKRHKFSSAFLFIDLDNFKSVNDNYGHNIGDDLIIESVRRIKSLLREEDVFARISGDEFAIMILNLDNDKELALEAIANISNKIINSISQEFLINNHCIKIGVSIGIKLFSGKEKNIQDIITHADIAMYQAKDNGRNQYVFFDK